MGLFQYLFGRSKDPAELTPANFRFLGNGVPRSNEPPDPDAGKQVEFSASTFMEASLLLPTFGKSVSTLAFENRVIAAAYLWGVVDALSQQARLYDVDTVAIYLGVATRKLAFSPNDAGLLTQIAQDPNLQAAVQCGGHAVLNWIGKRDEKAPLALQALLRGARD